MSQKKSNPDIFTIIENIIMSIGRGILIVFTVFGVASTVFLLIEKMIGWAIFTLIIAIASYLFYRHFRKK